MFKKFREAIICFRRTKTSIADKTADLADLESACTILSRVKRLNYIFGVFRAFGFSVGVCARDFMQFNFDASVLTAQKWFKAAQEVAASGRDNKNEIKCTRDEIERARRLKNHLDFPSRRKRRKQSLPNGYKLTGIDRADLSVSTCMGALNAVQQGIRQAQQCLQRSPSVECGASAELLNVEQNVVRFHLERRMNSRTAAEEAHIVQILKAFGAGPEKLEKIQSAFEEVALAFTRRAVKENARMLERALAKGKMQQWEKDSWRADMVYLMEKVGGSLQDFDIAPEEWEKFGGEKRNPDRPFINQERRLASLLKPNSGGRKPGFL